MDHTIEEAASGRAKCRACGTAITKGSLRLGERLPNPFSDDAPMTVWFHLACGAYRRPEAFLAALDAVTEEVDQADALRAIAAEGVERPRLLRAAGAERASSSRATCRSCREKIAKDGWRIRISFFEDGRFQPGGFIHAACAGDYFGTRDLLERVLHFTPGLSEVDTADFTGQL